MFGAREARPLATQGCRTILFLHWKVGRRRRRKIAAVGIRLFVTTPLAAVLLGSVSYFGALNLRRYWNMSLFLPFQELKILDLSDNQLVGFVQNEGLEKLRGLHNLKDLNLYGNDFNESIISSLTAGFSSLKSLNLAWNNLSLHHCLRHLQVLDISENFIRDSLPWCFSNLTSLEKLDLSNNFNQLSGNITSSPIRMMTSITSLHLSNNFFKVPSSLGPFFNLSKLQYVKLDNNIIYQDMELLPSSAVPKFQLEFLGLACCGDAGSFPDFLTHQSHLLYVSLSSINLKGRFPSWLLENNTNLRSLDLSNNSLSCPFQLFPHLNSSTSDIEILQKRPPSNDSASKRQKLAFSSQVYNLDISSNFLDGHIPRKLGAILPGIRRLNMSNNLLEGTIPTGGIDQYLEILDVGNNHLSGRIPNWIGTMPQLSQLIMANNYLEGPILLELCDLDRLTILDLSSNNLSGNLPSCLSPPGINHLHLSKNRFQGSLTDKFCNSTILVTLDLSHNQFSGTIPRCINKFRQLSYLFLNNNGIQGKISRKLCQLEKLSLLDLSHNNLSGLVPNCLNITTPSHAFEYYEHHNDVTREHYPTAYFPIEGPIEFTTKSASRSYKGRIITLMSGIDLSCNNLSGEIPEELGRLNKALHALNLSHNSLTGHIPMTFSDLKELESLDLSFNRLSGTIPPEIVELHFLEVLNVSYNNLSGQTPKQVAQFATFDDSSYKGNPLLCGEPLQRSCSGTVKPRNPAVEAGEDSDLSDMNIFCISFAVSYTVALLAIVTILWVNPHWRRAWFYYVDVVSSSCYYFVLDHIPICK